MLTYNIVPGSTDVSVVIRIVDSTDGTPETGVVYNTAGIALEYRRELAASTAITEATLAALTTAHADGGFLHIGNGYYRLDLPDAAVASGVAGCLVHGTVTGMVVIGCYIQLEGAVNSNYTRVGAPAGASVSADIAAMKVDTAAILVDTGTTLDSRIPAALVGGRMDANVGAISSDATAADNAEAFFDGTGYAGTNNVIPTVTAVTTTTNLTNLPAITANWLTTAGTAADFKAAMATAIWTDTVAGNYTAELSIGKSVMNGVALGTGLTINAYTGNTVQTGDSFARIGAAGAGLTAVVAASVTGAVGSVTGAVGSVTGAVGSVTGLTASDVGAIKAKTDSLTYTVAGVVDANIQRINDVTITGNGQVGTEFNV